MTGSFCAFLLQIMEDHIPRSMWGTVRCPTTIQEVNITPCMEVLKAVRDAILEKN